MEFTKPLLKLFEVLLLWQTTFLFCKSEGLGDLAKILAALAGEDECVFKCPNGVTPSANQRHKPTSNGCGSMGLQLDMSHIPGFEECCDSHDKCYDSCNNDRSECDEHFKSCLSGICLFEGLSNKKTKEEMKQCQTSADMMYAATTSLGCAAYLESQRNACLCNGRKLTREKMKKLNDGTKVEL